MKIARILFFVACAVIASTHSGCSCDSGQPESIDGYTGPELIYPPDSSTGISRTPFFNWGPGDIPSTVRWYGIVVKIPGASTRVVELRLQDTMYVCPDTLDAETTYEWWINGEVRSDEFIYSGKWEFTTGTGFNNPPGQPEIIAPAPGESCPADVTIEWTCFDPDSDVLTYDVWLGHSLTELTLVSEGQSETEYQANSLEHGTQYWLQIIAHDAESESVPNEDRSFYIIGSGEYHGIYAELMIHRSQYISAGIPPDPDEIIRIDHVYARFDSVYAPDGHVNPLRPAAVSYNAGGDVAMEWVESSSRYYKDNPYNLWFLAPGYDYTFTVTEGDGVPALTKAIYYPECGPYLNSPDAFSNVSKDGFTVTWSGHDMYDDCPTEIRIRIMDMGPMTWTDVDLMVPNTGTYTFTAGDLSGLDPMTYNIQVVLIIETKEYIDEPGYDPRSWAWARTHSTLFLYLQ